MRRLVLNLVTVTGILLVIALSNRFSSYLAKSASGQIPIDWIFKLVGLHIPELLSTLLPLGMMLSVLFAYGKLYANSEFIVLLCSGVNPRFILKITLTVGLAVAVVVAYLSLVVNPKTIDKREKAIADAESFALLQSIVPGKFQSSGDGRTVFYIEGLHSHHGARLSMERVFIAELPRPESQDQKTTLLIADQAEQKKPKKDQAMYIVLKNGTRYAGKPGTHDYTVMQFEEYGREIKRTESNSTAYIPHKAKTSYDLLFSTQAADQAELGWRLSLCLSVLILALIAVPLSEVNPRQGRFAHFLPAILLYIVYYNFLTISKRWVAAGEVNLWLGMGWVHLLFFSYAWYRLRAWAGFGK